MKGLLTNLFLPHSGNNHRSKLLHNQSLILVITFLFVASLILPTLQATFPQVLGISTNITTDQLLAFTNQKRVENGLAPLQFNEELSSAAALKAKDMFTKNYWAHTAPDGVTPWFFIKKVGYEYAYAGENLARGSTQATDIIDAWMASPSHRENMLSKNYEDIGFAFMEGKLNGQDTILVVEMFGNKGLPKTIVSQLPSHTTILEKSAGGSTQNSPSVLASLVSYPLLSNFFFHNLGVSLLVLFIFTLMLDMILVEKKKIVRFVGHNIDHILFLGMILLIIVVINRGIIL